MNYMKQENYQKFKKDIQAIIDAYEYLVRGIDKKAKADKTARAYGGIVRAGKGKLVESIAEQIILITWKSLGRDPARISFQKHTIKVPIKRRYTNKIKNPEVKKYILANIDRYYYGLKTDVCINIDGNFVSGVECKAYTENAMLKRILVDFFLRKEISPNLDCVLFQLESQLGGDYSELKDTTFGSLPTHTLLSYFDINLHIITLLAGERKVDKPIHKTEYYKPLTKENLYKSIQTFKSLLEKYK